MVVTLFPATVEIGVTHDRIGCPLICTVQHPHSAIPQPNLVPVIPSVSRKTHNSGICGETSTVCCLPFRVKETAILVLLSSQMPVSPVYNSPLVRFARQWYAGIECKSATFSSARVS